MTARTPKTAGKYHAYATEYPEYADAEGASPEVLSTLPVAGHKNRFVPSDTGRSSTAGAGRGKQGGAKAEEVEGKKKGGKVKSAAKGWGIARGARAAKYS